MATDNKIQIFQYNGSPITFQMGDCVMVNATEMAKAFDKRPIDWLQNKQTEEFLNELSKVRKSTLADLVQVTRGGDNPGTWMHEDVALEFARWLSPAFSIWCNDRIKELLQLALKAYEWCEREAARVPYLTPRERELYVKSLFSAVCWGKQH